MKTLKGFVIIAFFWGCTFTEIAMAQTAVVSDSLSKYIKEKSSHDILSDSPLIFIDGVEIELSDLIENDSPLFNSQIRHIEYLKKDNDLAIDAYGEKARGGVLFVTTIDNKEVQANDMTKELLVLMGGKKISYREMQDINPHDIQSIMIIKEEFEVQKITNEGYEAVIIITMSLNQ